MQNHLTEAYAHSRILATADVANRRRVDDVWEPRGSHRPVVAVWEQSGVVRRLFDRISYSERYARAAAGGVH